MLKDKLIVISGGFDPIHTGHTQLIRHAKKLGGDEGRLLVILNSDEWLTRKKGKPFMNFEERMRIIKALRYVDFVEQAIDEDGTVVENLKTIKERYGKHYHITFANGGDRGKTNTPESKVCKELGINMVWDIGGGKVQSSSWLLKGWKDG